MSRVLIVDDDLDNLLVACATLEAGGHQALGTTSPSEALELVRGGEIDAAILDIMMPRVSGFELLRQIRQCPEGARLPVMFLSGLTGSEAHVRGLRAGADDYLDRPYNPGELLARLERLLSRFGQSGDQLSGTLSGLGLADLLQILHESRRSGMLHLATPKSRGTIQLGEGRIFFVSFRGKTGRRALFELLEITEGSFGFAVAEGGNGAGPATDSAQPPIDLRSCLIESAWVADEYHRRIGLLPADDKRYLARVETLRVSSNRDLRALPLEETFEAIRRLERPSMSDLLAADLGPTRHVRLTVAVLLEEDQILCDRRSAGSDRAVNLSA